MFDTKRKLNALRFQSHVYAAAREWILEKCLESVLDVGCGCPEKLRRYVFPVSSDVTGMDIEDGDNFSEYDMIYHHVDFENSLINLNKTFGMIICADVAEHITSVSNLFELIKLHANRDTYIVFSTPDVDSIDVAKINVHKGHVNHWNREAFTLLLECHGFNVINSILSKEFVNETVYYNSHVCLCKIKEVSKNGDSGNIAEK